MCTKLGDLQFTVGTQYFNSEINYLCHNDLTRVTLDNITILILNFL